MSDLVNEYFKWEDVATLTPEVVEAFKNVHVCQRAIKKIVQEVVREAEKSDLAESALWELVEEEYKISVKDRFYTYQISGDKLQRRSIGTDKADEYLKNGVIKDEIKKGLKERFFKKKK